MFHRLWCPENSETFRTWLFTIYSHVTNNNGITSGRIVPPPPVHRDKRSHKRSKRCISDGRDLGLARNSGLREMRYPRKYDALLIKGFAANVMARKLVNRICTQGCVCWWIEIFLQPVSTRKSLPILPKLQLQSGKPRKMYNETQNYYCNNT